MARELMKLEVLKNETMSKLNEVFRRKVQLEEETKENEASLQFHRGVLQGLNAAQKVIQEVGQGIKVEELLARRTKELSEVRGE